MGRRFIIAAVATLCCVIGPASVADAQEPGSTPTRTAKQKAEARKLVYAGDTHYGKGEYAAALDNYRRAHGMMNVPTTGVEVAKTLVALRRLVEAREAYRSVVATPPRPDEPPLFAKTRDKARAQLVELDRLIPSLLIEVVGGDEVAVTLDGVPLALVSGATTSQLDPGKHIIVAESKGHESKRIERNLAESERARLEIRFGTAETPSPGPPSPGTPAPDPAPPDVPDDGPPIMPVMSWIGFGVAAAGTLVGIGLGAAAIGVADDARAKCPTDKTCAPDAQDDIDSGTTLAHASTVSFVIAGVGAAVGAVGLVLDLTSEPNSADANLVIGPTGFAVDGRF